MTADNDDWDAPARARMEEASDWCVCLADGALDADSQRRFDDWLAADPDNRAAFEEMLLVWHGTGAIADQPDFVKLRAQSLDWMHRMGRRRRRRAPLVTGRRVVAIAAAAAALVALVVTIWLRLHDPMLRYETEVGERRQVVLADGSRLSLDAATQVEVRYDERGRALRLLAGRARFDVAKDPLRPFSVTAGDKTVVATGTAFSVELLQRQVHVVLFEGKVEVLGSTAAPADKPKATAKESLASRALRPGQELVARTEGPALQVAPTDLERASDWEDGRLSFVDEPLALAVERVNRYSDVKLIIADDATGRLRVNGIFDAGDTRGFVSGIASLFPVEVQQQEDWIILASRSDKNE